MKLKEDGGFLEALRILEKQKSCLGLLIGNGINLVAKTDGGISWNQLMENLISAATAKFSSHSAAKKRLKRLIQSGRNGQTPASLPEVFDIIGATQGIKAGTTTESSSKLNLQSEIANLLAQMKPGPTHKALIDWAERSQVPILTTNYDHCLQDALKDRECKRWRFGTGGPISDYYPWDRYYAPRKIRDPLEEFAVWHIHGDRALRRSIRAGLDQYMGMVQRLRKIKQPVAKEVLHGPKEGQENAPAFHSAPWLRIFMGRKLWIQGLAVRTDEVSIRWLLIQRFRYWGRYRPKQCFASGWYIHISKDDKEPIDKERKVFFESVGLKVIEISKADKAYCKLFDNDG
jgi:hypothetical protein